MKDMEKINAIDCDELSIEVFKTFGRKEIMCLTKFLNWINKTRIQPKKFLDIIVPMKKKTDVKRYKDYRIIILLFHIGL